MGNLKRWKTDHCISASTEVTKNMLFTTSCLSNISAQPALVGRSFVPSSRMKETKLARPVSVLRDE